jgi:dimeric dUTPase (all-alpha-NTP-PPase superfamily)
MADRLEMMFFQQRQLNRRFGVNPSEMTDKEREDWALKYSLALAQELAEFNDSVHYKWWSHCQNTNWQNAKIEVIDMLHFLISLAQIAGMTEDDLFDRYEQKMRVNIVRQTGGYITKDEHDCEHILADGKDA